AAARAVARLSAPRPDPTTIRSGLPSDLVTIDRKALATEPADRWSSASSMAAALEAFLGGTAVPGPDAAAAAAGVAAASAITSATAKANPNAIPYAPDAYASGSPPQAPPPFQPIDTDDEDHGTPMTVWAAGIAALAILAIAGFLVFRLLSGPGGSG